MDWLETLVVGQGIGLWLFIAVAMIYIFLGFGLFFLLVRPIILWYFKIRAIVKRLDENNKLQSQILEQLKIMNASKEEKGTKTETDHSSYMPK